MRKNNFNMYFFYIIFIFIGFINYIYSFVHITLYVICDDLCTNIYLDETPLVLDNFDTTLNFRFQKINFYANPGQKITIIDQNNSGNFGIAAKIIIQSNSYYIYDTKNNLDMFSSTITHEINRKPFNKCYVQTYIDICNELEYYIGASDYSSYQNKPIEFYFTIPNELNHETLYVNDNKDFILAYSNNININLNEFFPNDDENYIGIYYTKYNDIDIKGKFYDNNGNEIALETIYYDKELYYVSNENYNDMYNDIIYYEFTHGEYFEEDNSKKYINILYCPNYCEYCTSEKLCIKPFSYSYNLQVYAINTISTRNLNYLTDNYTFLIFSTNNKMNLINSKLDIISLNNCLNNLKSNTDYDSEYDFAISAYFNGYNLIEFNAYDQEGNIVEISNECIINHYDSSSSFLSCFSSVQSSSSFLFFSSNSYSASSNNLDYSSSYSASSNNLDYSFSYSASSNNLDYSNSFSSSSNNLDYSSSLSTHSSYSSSESSYSSSSSSDLSCYEHCLTCEGKNYNECTSCELPYTLTSRKTCIDLGEICGNTSLLWYFYYDNDKIECISGYQCQNKTSKYIVETFECLPDCDNYIFSDKYKCI